MLYKNIILSIVATALAWWVELKISSTTINLKPVNKYFLSSRVSPTQNSNAKDSYIHCESPKMTVKISDFTVPNSNVSHISCVLGSRVFTSTYPHRKTIQRILLVHNSITYNSCTTRGLNRAQYFIFSFSCSYHTCCLWTSIDNIPMSLSYAPYIQQQDEYYLMILTFPPRSICTVSGVHILTSFAKRRVRPSIRPLVPSCCRL